MKVVILSDPNVRRKMAVYLAVGLVAAMGLNYYFSDTPRADAPPPAAARKETAPIQSSGVMPKGYQPNQVIRDPFAVPDEFKPKPPGIDPAVAYSPRSSAALPAGKMTGGMPELKGVVSGGANKIAIIQYGPDSRSYKIGEMIGPYQLLAIYETSATLWGPGGKLALTLGR